MGAAEARIDGCVAYRSLVRYDAYGEMSGRQSSSIALLDARRSGRGRLLDPPPRPGRRVRQAGRRGRVRARALAGGAGGGRHRARARRPSRGGCLMRVAFLGPAGHLHRGGAAGLGPDGRRGGALPHRLRDRHGRAGAAQVDRAVVPIENSLEGGVGATLDALAGEADRRADRGRGRAPDPPLPDRRAPARAGRGRAGALAPPGHRAVRALPARAPAGRRAVAAASTAEAVRDGAPRRTSRGRRSGRACRPSSTAARCSPSGVEDRPDNLTRFVWLAPARRRGASTPDGPRQDLGRLLGLQRRVARVRSSRACRVRRPRHQPHPDRVATAPRARSATTCSSPTSRASSDDAAGAPRRSRRCASGSRRCGCSAPTPLRRSRA